jgi:hypothetical protein
VALRRRQTPGDKSQESNERLARVHYTGQHSAGQRSHRIPNVCGFAICGYAGE